MANAATAIRFRFVIPRKSRISPDAPSAKGFRWVFNKLQDGADLAGKVEIRHDGACGRCGRSLTVPASVDTGFGPHCADKLGIPWDATGEGLVFDPLAFILGGNARVTVTSCKTGQRFTYKVRRANKGPEETRPYFVSLLRGQDNDSDFTWMGMLFPEER
jgi:hypothetical protein